MKDFYQDQEFDQEQDRTIVHPMRIRGGRPSGPSEPPEPPSNRVPLKRIIAALIAVVLVIILALLGFKLGAAFSRPETEEVTAEPTLATIYHPLTGIQIAGQPSGRVYCVSVDNSPEARPQSGVERASLVYEMPAEADIPRLLLCYYNVNVDTIGPVRSARPYIVNTARGWNGLFAHCGWSPEAQQLLESQVTDYVNEFAYSDYFWRDSSRSAPHNLYTSTDLLKDAASDLGYQTEQEVPSFSFRHDGELLAGPAVSEIDLDFQGAYTSYVYDESRRAYGRYVGNYQYVDASTGNQIYAANIIVQYVDSQVLDNEGRLAVDLTAGGEALLFTNGVMIRGSWSRESLDQPTQFLDENGNEFSLTPGQTWIEMCNATTPVSYGLTGGEV